MSNKENNLILAIQIDSGDLHLVAGFVKEDKVNVLAIRRTKIEGISKGSLIDKDEFDRTFILEIRRFLDDNLFVINDSEVKKLNLQTHSPDAQGNIKVVVGRIAFNRSALEQNGKNLIQSDLIKHQLAANFFQDQEYNLNNLVIKSYFPDIAATDLLVKTDPEFPYNINIHFGMNSTCLNFIDGTPDQPIQSRVIEFGFSTVVAKFNTANENQGKPPVDINKIYKSLRNYDFIPRRITSVKVKFVERTYMSSFLMETFVKNLQRIFFHCYDKFCELDVNNLRFKPGFTDKVKINFMGYGADFLNLHELVALIFSYRLRMEINERQAQHEQYASKTKSLTRSLTRESDNSQNFSFNTKTGAILAQHEGVDEQLTTESQSSPTNQEAKNDGKNADENANKNDGRTQTSVTNLIDPRDEVNSFYFPQIKLQHNEIIYLTPENKLNIKSRALSVKGKFQDLTSLCTSLGDNRHPSNFYMHNIDQFASALGLIYLLNQEQPEIQKTGF